ncbi:MAG TPA: hypothetical protein GX724_03815 [Fibrobacter sp.]|nr:hypothetical protein [Fibrobacter sp.]
MKSDWMDILVDDAGDDVEITLRGTFGLLQLPAVREKIEMLIKGPGCFFFLNLEKARFIDDAYLDLFLNVLNRIRKQNAVFILISSQEEHREYFSRYSHILELYDNKKIFRQSGILKQLKQVGINYSKQTGLRLSPGVAIALFVLLLGWFVTLFSIVHSQSRNALEQQALIMNLENQKKRSVQEIEKLKSSLGSLQNLGLVVDSTTSHAFGSIRDWVSYLEFLENSRREN